MEFLSRKFQNYLFIFLKSTMK